LVICIEREICEPHFFNTYEEAYKKMEKQLISEIIDACNDEEHLNDEGELITLCVPYEFQMDEYFMWSNLDDDKNVDAKIFYV